MERVVRYSSKSETVVAVVFRRCLMGHFVKLTLNRLPVQTLLCDTTSKVEGAR